MTIDQFWTIVEDVHLAAPDGMELKCELLVKKLEALDIDEITSFADHFEECDRLAYDYGLWGAAYVINGGCGDDTFMDFRAALISHGRGIFEQALADPDSIANLPVDVNHLFYESYAHAVIEADRNRSGPHPCSDSSPYEPTGENWLDDKTLATRFPKLHAKYARSFGSPVPNNERNRRWWKFW